MLAPLTSATNKQLCMASATIFLVDLHSNLGSENYYCYLIDLEDEHNDSKVVVVDKDHH